MRILVVSSSRADWGLLAPVLAELRKTQGFEAQLALTGQHLMPGSSSLEGVRNEGFAIDHLVDIGLSDEDSPAAAAQAMGSAVAQFGELLARSRPDLMMVLGDRYEILAVVAAAQIASVPVAHLCGGDVTEGAIDDAIRHAVTKLASLHFVSNSQSFDRVRQLGEPDERIFDVGSPGLDRIRSCAPLERHELLAELGLPKCDRFFVATYHPETLARDVMSGCRAMLKALDAFPQIGLVFTGSNADPGARAIDALVKHYAAARRNATFHETLGSHRYFSALAHADAVIGNSSSGIYEAPSFNVPTINIGDRQKGRLRASSVIDCAANVDDIRRAIDGALRMDCSMAVNPYGDGTAAAQIAHALQGLGDTSSLARKTFVDRLQ